MTQVLANRVSARPRHSRLITYAPIIVALILRFASGPTADLSYLVIAGYALAGRTQAIQALALSWLFTMVNPGLAPEAGAVGRYVVIAAAAAAAAFHGGFLTRHLRVRAFTLATILLFGFIVIHSLLFSPMLDVSLLKAASWGLAATALFSAWLGLSGEERDRLSGRLFWGLVLVLFVSLPLLVMPQGYLRNGTGFQGVLGHPQVFGLTMALLGAWAAARMFAERRPSWGQILLTGACLVAVLLSEARTGGLAMVFGVGLSLLLSPAFARRSILAMAPGLRSGRLLAILSVVVLAGVAMAPLLAGVIQRFLTKSHRSGTAGLYDAYEGSRGPLMHAMLENIRDDPMGGIGFGMASDPSQMVVERDPVFGVPLGAAIEKGTVFLAVPEELGLIGAVFFVGWVFWLLRGSARGGLAPFAVCLTALILNVGENTLFSAGGQGLLVLILFAWAYANGHSYPGTVRHG